MKEKAFVALVSDYLDRQELANSLRQKYDPIADQFPAHITIVFPQSNIRVDELNIMAKKTILSTKPWHLILNKLHSFQDKSASYIFLSPEADAEQQKIVAWHKAIYKNHELAKTLYEDRAYTPHITLGRFKNLADAEKVLHEAINQFKPFNALFNKIITGTIHDKIISVYSETVLT